MESNTAELQPLILIGEGASDERIVIQTSPFRVGRKAENDLTLLHRDISGLHAQFVFTAGDWIIIDEGSTNGTFVNGTRISDPTRLASGDLLHLGNNGFQIQRGSLPGETHASQTMVVSQNSAERIRAAADLVQVLMQRRVFPHFQPIISLADDSTVGWEALGRAITQTGSGPGPLLQLAYECNKAVDLSQAFTRASVECATCRHCWPRSQKEFLFFNTHPKEIGGPGFQDTIRALGSIELTKWYRPVVEIPESLACKTDQMAGWVEEIRSHKVLVAYDDFGKGQSRISDMLEVPPDFLKIDRDLVTNLDTAKPKQTVMRAVVEACASMGVKTIGEGIETPAELSACREIGIDYGQGFLLKRPAPVHELFAIDNATLPTACPFVRLKLLAAR